MGCREGEMPKGEKDEGGDKDATGGGLILNAA